MNIKPRMALARGSFPYVPCSGVPALSGSGRPLSGKVHEARYGCRRAGGARLSLHPSRLLRAGCGDEDEILPLLHGCVLPQP